MKRLIFVAAIAVVICILSFVPNGILAEGDYSDKKALVEELVNEAAGLIETKGEEAISIIKDQKGKFYTNDTYVFITSAETGADLVNPAFEGIEGVPADEYSDADAWAAQKIIVAAVKDKDTAWVEYFWPRPGEDIPYRKIAYLKKIIINDKIRIVGAGFYPEDAEAEAE